MKILSLLVVLLAVFRETRHQFPIFYPPFSISLANEEFIEPPPIVVDDTPPVIVVPNSPPSAIDSTNGGQKDNNLRVKDSTRTNVRNSDISPPPATTPVLSLQDFKLGHHRPTKSVFVDTEKDGHSSVGQPETAANGNNVIVTEGGEGVIVTDGSQQAQQSSSPPPPGPVVLDDIIDTPKKGDDEEPIPSYMEWAQKKQLELKSNIAAAGQNGHSSGSPGGNGGNHHQSQGGQNGQANGMNGSVASSSGIDAKNYKNFASPDCGAKVVQSNVESQNPSGVLSSSHDEYMLNKCGTAIWFVVELCEPLTVERISIGNLELFSSSPKEVEFGISDRYPTRDWTKIGPITLPDARAIHPVVLPATNSSTFGKFVKFSVHSHYGSEHYCPISVIRVNGKTEYEVLESETTHQEDENKEGGSLYEEPIEEQTQTATESSGGKVGGLKDAVLNMLNKAVQSIVRRGYSSDSIDSSETDQLLKYRCRSVLQCVPHSPMTHDIYRFLSCNSSNVLPFLAAHSHWCGWDYCHSTFESRSIGLPWQPEGFYASLFGGPTVLHALCHYLKPLTDGCDPTCLAMNNTLQHHESSAEYTNESITNNNNDTIGGFPAAVNTEQEAQIPRPTVSQQQNERTDEQLSISPTNPTGSSNGGDTTQASTDKQQQESPPLSSSGTAQQISPTTDLNNGSPPPLQQQQQNHQQQQQQETQIQPPIVTDDYQQGSGQPQQKESVFVRLTNRIKNLERNQSLTASYLEELSKRFKKQNEDNAIIVDLNKKTLNETRFKLFQLDSFYRQESQSLRRNLDDVRERLFNVQLQRSLLVIICVSQTLLIVGAIIWAKRKFARIGQQLEFVAPTTSLSSPRRLTLSDILSSSSCQSQEHQQPMNHQDSNRRRDSDPLVISATVTTTTTDNNNHENARLMIMRKRSNSDSLPNEKEKAKRLRKKNKKQQVLNARATTNSNTKPAEEISHDFNITMPKSSSGDGFFNVPQQVVNSITTSPRTSGSLLPKNTNISSNSSVPFTSTKENVDPQFARTATTMQPPSSSGLGLPKSKSLVNSTSNSPTFQNSRPSSLQQKPNSTKVVDSQLFTFQSQITPPFIMDSSSAAGISTSSRFALLASPVRDSHSPTPSFSGRERYFMPSSSIQGGVSSSTTANIPYQRSGSTESSNSVVSTQSGSPPSSSSTGGFKGIFNGSRHHKTQHSPSVSSSDSASIPASAVITETTSQQGKKGAGGGGGSKKGGSSSGLKAFAKFFER